MGFPISVRAHFTPSKKKANYSRLIIGGNDYRDDRMTVLVLASTSTSAPSGRTPPPGP